MVRPCPLIEQTTSHTIPCLHLGTRRKEETRLSTGNMEKDCGKGAFIGTEE